MNFLKMEGFVPKVVNDSNIIFKYEGRTHALLIQEDDPNFFRIVFPNFWKIENGIEMIKVLKVINVVNRKMKVAKLFVSDDDEVSTIVEMFIEDNPILDQFFMRSLKAVQHATNEFVEIMNSTPLVSNRY